MTTKSAGRKTKTSSKAIAKSQSGTKAKSSSQPAARATKAPRPAERKKLVSAAAPESKAQQPMVAPVAKIEPTRDSKQARLIALLQEPTGASIEQMMTLTGWQAHTVRGTISAVLRKKLGLNVTSERSTDAKARCYRIAGAAVGA